MRQPAWRCDVQCFSVSPAVWLDVPGAVRGARDDPPWREYSEPLLHCCLCHVSLVALLDPPPPTTLHLCPSSPSPFAPRPSHAQDQLRGRDTTDSLGHACPADSRYLYHAPSLTSHLPPLSPSCFPLQDQLRGRGTTDCLGHAALLAQVFKWLAEHKPKLKRTLVGVWIANEENSKVLGIGVRAQEQGDGVNSTQ